jgi:signal transduction histidine kinase
LRERVPGLLVAVIGVRGNVTAAVAAMRAHAFDYLEEPVKPQALAELIRCARRTLDPQRAALLHSLQVLTPGLVHELRNPLSGILAGSQMVARLLGGQGTASEYAEIIREEAQQLERFLARLAEFGRLRSAGLQCADSVDLPGLVGRLLETASPACKARGIRVVSSFDPRATGLRGDPGRLSQACMEIVQNAQEAMPEGGTLTVSTRLVADNHASGSDGLHADLHDDWIEVEFRDTGPGMSEEVRQHAGEPFFSTRPRALGIGLSLAQAIAHAHGGMLVLGGANRRGGHVLLSLPVTRGAGAAAASSPSVCA